MNRINLCLLFFLTIFTSSVIRPMESEDNICAEINSISPDAPESDYLSLMQRMKNKGESVCSCIKKIIGKRIDESKKSLSQEWNIDSPDWENISKFVSTVSAQDNQNGDVAVKSTRIINKENDPFIDPIVALFKDAGYKNGELYIVDESALSHKHGDKKKNIIHYSAYLTRPILSKKNPIENQRLKFENIYPGPYTLNLGTPYSMHSPEAKRGILSHEAEHMRFQDPIVGSLLFSIASIQDPKIAKNSSMFFDSNSVKEYTRSIEARADQLSASRDLNNAMCVEKWHTEDIAFKNKYKTKIIESSDHDSSTTRLAMATCIRKLKQAEKKLDKLSKE